MNIRNTAFFSNVDLINKSEFPTKKSHTSFLYKVAVENCLQQNVNRMSLRINSLIKNVITSTKAIGNCSALRVMHLYRRVFKKPLSYYKTSNIVIFSDKKNEPIIRNLFLTLKNEKLFQLWIELYPRSEEEQVRHLLDMAKKGGCLGQTLTLLFLMETHSSCDTEQLRTYLKSNHKASLYFQLLGSMIFEIKEAWLKKEHTNDKDFEEMRKLIPHSLEVQWFHHLPGFNSFKMTDSGLHQMVETIRSHLKKAKQIDSKIDQNFCIPVALDDWKDGDQGHVFFMQFGPKYRLYDCFSHSQGFFDFLDEEELLQFLPEYFQNYYSSLCETIQLPCVFSKNDGCGVLIEIHPENIKLERN